MRCSHCISANVTIVFNVIVEITPLWLNGARRHRGRWQYNDFNYRRTPIAFDKYLYGHSVDTELL